MKLGKRLATSVAALGLATAGLVGFGATAAHAEGDTFTQHCWGMVDTAGVWTYGAGSLDQTSRDAGCLIQLEQWNKNTGGTRWTPWSHSITDNLYYHDGVHYLAVCLHDPDGSYLCGPWVG
jgi:hypothetical protein